MSPLSSLRQLRSSTLGRSGGATRALEPRTTRPGRRVVAAAAGGLVKVFRLFIRAADQHFVAVVDLPGQSQRIGIEQRGVEHTRSQIRAGGIRVSAVENGSKDGETTEVTGCFCDNHPNVRGVKIIPDEEF